MNSNAKNLIIKNCQGISSKSSGSPIWLVKEKRQKQVLHAHCKHNSTQTLFDDEIQTKLTQKCK